VPEAIAASFGNIDAAESELMKSPLEMALLLPASDQNSTALAHEQKIQIVGKRVRQVTEGDLQVYDPCPNWAG
jgi:hypothetical protein